MPVRNRFVGDTSSHIEHQNSGLATDVVTVTQATELLLAGGVPAVEDDGAQVGVERKRVHLDTLGGYAKRKRKQRQN